MAADLVSPADTPADALQRWILWSARNADEEADGLERLAALLAVGERDKAELSDLRRFRETAVLQGLEAALDEEAELEEAAEVAAVLAGEEDAPRTRTEVGFAECGDAIDLAEGFAAFWHHDKTSDRRALAEWSRQLHDEVRKVLDGLRAAGEGDT